MKSISYYAVIGVFDNEKKLFDTAKTLKKAIGIAHSYTGAFQFHTFYIVHHTIEYEKYIVTPEDYDISNPLAVITIEDSIAFTSGKGKEKK